MFDIYMLCRLYFQMSPVKSTVRPQGAPNGVHIMHLPFTAMWELRLSCFQSDTTLALAQVF
jgi:hypothetical protein